MSQGHPTALAQLETDEQGAHRVADAVSERFDADNLAVSLSDAGGGRWQVAIHFRERIDRDAVWAAVRAAAGSNAAKKLRFSHLQAADWARKSLAGLAPVAAGRFIVHGAHDRHRVPVNRIGIEIEAALAFGTGHHGTTRGCLLALDRICKVLDRRRRGPRILDVGTGSGVLAIAAARALRRRALASDIDPSAVSAARQNVRLNRAAGLVEAIQAVGVSAQRIRSCAPFDLIFANILLGPLKRMASPLRHLAAPGARLVLSGVLASQANAVIASYRPLALERRIDLDGWTTLVLKRRTPRRAVAPARSGS